MNTDLAPHVEQTMSYLRNYYHMLDLDNQLALVARTVEACRREMEDFCAAKREGRDYDKPFRVPLTVAERHSRQLSKLIPEHRNVTLCFMNDCNALLGDESPYADHPVQKLHGHRANYDALWKPNTRSKPAPQAKAEERAEKGKVIQLDQHRKKQLPPPDPAVTRLFEEWFAKYQAWIQADDSKVLMPEYPPAVVEDVRLRAPGDPEMTRVLRQAENYIQARERQINLLTQAGLLKQAPTQAAKADAQPKAKE